MSKDPLISIQPADLTAVHGGAQLVASASPGNTSMDQLLQLLPQILSSMGGNSGSGSMTNMMMAMMMMRRGTTA